MGRGQLFIISGPSGVGKGTVRAEIFRKYQDELNLQYSISVTTRYQREKEVNGVDYYFISDEEFAERIRQGTLLEHAVFVNASYGTPKEKVEESLNAGYNVVLEIEVQGALQVMEKMPEAISIFLLPPSFEELEARIRHRGTDPEEKIIARLKQAKQELETKDRYSYCVVNETVDQAVEDIVAIMRKHIA